MSARLNVLLVEDDDVDFELVTRALENSTLDAPVRRAHDGLEALRILRGEDGPALAAPYVILLDLRMPRMGGLEFLESIRSNPELRSSKVIVLTTSESGSDRQKSMESHVAAYVQKSEIRSDASMLATLIARISEWSPTVETGDGDIASLGN